MKIKIIGLRSDETKDYILKEFEKEIKNRLQDYEITTSEDFDIALFTVATGGVENQFKSIYNKFKPPYILIYNEFNNSLPASLEILSFLKKESLNGTLIDVNSITKEALQKFFPLAGLRVGLIGRPSDWLIASQYPLEFYKERFNMEVLYIPIDEAIENYKMIDTNEAESVSHDFIKNAKEIIGINKEEVIKASKFYLALKAIIEKYELDHISVRCFDIIKPLDTTGCLALSRLIDEGFIAGCEGDLPSTISMIILKKITLKTPFLANVSYIEDTKDGVFITLAHCTIGLRATKGYNLRTHFETNKGVGIEGFFEHGPVTILRIGGKELDSGVVIEGEEVEINFSNSRCRTQLKLKVPKVYKEYFLNRPLGNHHIVVSGHFRKALEEVFTLLGLKKI